MRKRDVMMAAVVALAVFGADVRAQAAAPGTDVWIVPMKQIGIAVSFGEPKDVTNRPGYDNQPSFTAKGDAVLYTSTDNAGKTDTWRFTVPDGKPARLTNLPMSVYSPTVTPDGKTFSVIRVEPDSAQRLWRVPLDGQGAPSLMLEPIKGKIGYHIWTGDHSLVIYVLGSGRGPTATPSTLQVIADERAPKGEVVASNVGRALAKVPGRNAITYQQLVKDSLPWIVDLDLASKQSRRLVETPKGADYHVWAPNGALLTAVGSGIFRYTDDGWAPVANFEKFGVKNITRLAISPKGNWLAFVAEDKGAP
jgi:WD40-like Beta Propeller Repeat